MYKRISNTRTIEELDDVKAETIDRFGPLPESAATLFELARTRFTTSAMGIKGVDIGARGGRITFAPDASIDPAGLVHLVQSAPDTYHMRGPETLIIRSQLDDKDHRLRILRDTLQGLSSGMST